MNFPGHLDKASMIHHLEEFDALHGGEDRFSKDWHSSKGCWCTCMLYSRTSYFSLEMLVVSERW